MSITYIINYLRINVNYGKVNFRGKSVPLFLYFTSTGIKVMLQINEVIVVEGNHDKIKLQEVVDAIIIPTNGFSIYGDKEKLLLLKKLAKERGLIILTDSDSAGKRIRTYIKNCIGNINVKHAYIPQIEGKERRKSKASAEGTLGVEGMNAETLEMVLIRAGCLVTDQPIKNLITKTDLYEDGLIGMSQSKLLRQRLCKEIDFPLNLSTNVLIEVLNSLYSLEEYRNILKKILI